VQLGARTVEVANDGGHAGLVAHGSGQVNGLLGVILWKAIQVAVRTFSAAIEDVMMRTS